MTARLALRATVAGAALFVAARAPLAQAQTAPPSLSVVELGYPTGISLRGTGGTVTLTVPVNPGLVPTALMLDVEPSPTVRRTVLRLASPDGVIGFVAVTQHARVRVPIAPARVRGPSLAVTLSAALQNDSTICRDMSLDELVIAGTSRVEYAGSELPARTVAEFLPPHLERLIVSVPARVTPEAAQMVLWLSTELGRRYRARTVALDVVPRGDGDQAPAVNTPFTRVLIWRDGDTTAVSATGALTIGRLDEARQLFLTREGFPLAIGPTLRSTLARPDSAADTLTLVTLDRLGGPRSAAADQPIAIPFSLADFGADRFPRRMRLVTRQSRPHRNENASIQISLNGYPVGSTRVDENETVFDVDLPERLLRRDNELTAVFQYSRRSACSIDVNGFGGTILGESGFILAQGPVMAAGFERFPQAALTRLGVRLSPMAWPEAERAAALLQAMQRTTRRALRPALETNTARSAGMLLAVGNEALATELKAPVRTPGFRVRDRSGAEWLAFDPAVPYAALQAFQDDKGDVLLLSNTGSSGVLADTLVTEALESAGWFGLTGDLALRGPSSRTVTLQLARTEFRLDALPAPTAGFFERYRSLIVGGGLALLLLLLYLIYPRIVRRETPGA